MLRDFKPVPVCVEKLGPNGYRQMKCGKCGLGASSVHPEGPPMKGGGKG